MDLDYQNLSGCLPRLYEKFHETKKYLRLQLDAVQVIASSFDRASSTAGRRQSQLSDLSSDHVPDSFTQVAAQFSKLLSYHSVSLKSLESYAERKRKRISETVRVLYNEFESAAAALHRQREALAQLQQKTNYAFEQQTNGPKAEKLEVRLKLTVGETQYKEAQLDRLVAEQLETLWQIDRERAQLVADTQRSVKDVLVRALQQMLDEVNSIEDISPEHELQEWFKNNQAKASYRKTEFTSGRHQPFQELGAKQIKGLADEFEVDLGKETPEMT